MFDRAESVSHQHRLEEVFSVDGLIVGDIAVAVFATFFLTLNYGPLPCCVAFFPGLSHPPTKYSELHFDMSTGV